MKLNNVTHRLLGKEKHWKLKWLGKPKKKSEEDAANVEVNLIVTGLVGVVENGSKTRPTRGLPYPTIFKRLTELADQDPLPDTVFTP